MNKDRRKALNELQDRLTAAQEKFIIAHADFIAELGDIKDALEGHQSDEQDYYDNMPEGLQNGDKGETAEAAISEMESAVSEIDDVINTDLDLEALNTAFSHIEEAKGTA